MRIRLLIFFLVFLLSCAPQTADSRRQTVAYASPTPTPTETLTSTSTPTPTETPTPTPEPITLTGTFGLEPEVAAKFAGAERYIRRAENGTYLVTAFYRDPQTKKLTPLELELLPDTFSDHPEIKNPLAPLTVVGRLKADPSQPRFSITSSAPAPTETPTTPTPTHHSDQEDFLEYILPPKNTNFLLDDQDFWPKAEERVPSIEEMPIYGPLHEDYKLIWTGKEFRLAYTFPALFEGVGTENPRLIAENLEKIPFIPIEDIQSGLAVQSLLAHILERMDKGESLADILYLDPEAVRQNWQKLGGNSLLFELLPDGKVAWLKAKGNDQSAKELRYDNMTMKILPLVANLEINGANYSAFYMANFDPIDPQNPDPEDLSNWKFFLSFPFNQNVLWEKSFSAKAPLVPYILLYGDEKYQQNHPLLAQLLSIEGNDASLDDFWRSDIHVRIEDPNRLTPQNPVIEVPLYTPGIPYQVPPSMQTDVVLFEVGVAQ